MGERYATILAIFGAIGSLLIILNTDHIAASLIYLFLTNLPLLLSFKTDKEPGSSKKKYSSRDITAAISVLTGVVIVCLQKLLVGITKSFEYWSDLDGISIILWSIAGIACVIILIQPLFQK